MIMIRDKYEDALDAAFTHPLQHMPFVSSFERPPLRPLKRTRTPPRTPKSPCLSLPLPLPPFSETSPSSTASSSSSAAEDAPPLASPRSPFLPTSSTTSASTLMTCRHCGLAYPNPEIDAYTPDELEQLDFLHALGNWAWDNKCARKLARLRAPFERLHRARPTFAEAIGAAARTAMNDFASQLVAAMDAQQCRINENLNSLKLHIMCNLHGHDGDATAEAWDKWMRGRTPWASETLRAMNAGSRGDPAALALELFRDVLRDLGEDEVVIVPYHRS